MTIRRDLVLAACVLTAASSPLPPVSGTLSATAHAPQAAASDPAPRFEVATIRVNRSGEPRSRIVAPPGTGQLTITNIVVAELIQAAYDLQLASQLVNVSDWARSQRVDVVAKAESPAPLPVLQRMLQPLLAEYFKLVTRRETRQMDTLALVALQSGRLGPRLQRTSKACEGAVGTTNRFALAPDASAGSPQPCGILPGGAGRIVARGLDMAGLAALLAPSQRRIVIDRTGLAGRFDIDLTYTPDAFSAAALAQRPGATVPPGVDPSGPPLATALQEQLGLKFEGIRAPVEVVVIDRIERPSQD